MAAYEDVLTDQHAVGALVRGSGRPQVVPRSRGSPRHRGDVRKLDMKYPQPAEDLSSVTIPTEFGHFEQGLALSRKSAARSIRRGWTPASLCRPCSQPELDLCRGLIGQSSG